MQTSSRWESIDSSRERKEPLIGEVDDENPDGEQLAATIVEREKTASPTLSSMSLDDDDFFSSDVLQIMGEQSEGTNPSFDPGLPSDSQHDSYSDHAIDPVVQKPKRRTRNRETFPMILHRLLSDTEMPGAADIIHWQPHGRAFCICNEEALEKFIISRYYRQSSVLSFKKQLRNYGFREIQHQGEDQGCFYHRYFLRGREDLCMYMHHNAGTKRARKEKEKRLKMEQEVLSMSPMPPPLVPQATSEI